MIGERAAALCEEAKQANERRVLVLAGSDDGPVTAAIESLDGAGIGANETTVVGPTDGIRGERLSLRDASDLLGQTRTAVVLDCRETFRPNALGRVVGVVDGGGLLVLLTPPLDDWSERPDGFDEWLAVPPFTEADVTGLVRKRLIDLTRAHPGIAIVDVDGEIVERDGLTNPAPRCRVSAPALPSETIFPIEAYEACLTADQIEAVSAFEGIGSNGGALVIEADRGRGKSSAAGLAAASLALEGKNVLVTAPRYRGAREGLIRAASLLSDLDALVSSDSDEDFHRLESEDGSIRFERPESASTAADAADMVIVDEAAGLPVRMLDIFLDARAVAFVTTVHGYEGAGRGFSVRFRGRLEESDHSVTDVTMNAPIRYADTDPIEPWAFRTLLLDASPAVKPLIENATPATATYERLEPEDLLADEHLLRETFGLLVLAHYRTEPDDLARLLDAPNVSARALLHDGHVVSVALLAREGGLPADLRTEMYEGDRVRGNMIPDVLTTQLRDEEAGVPVGQRVLRIATHPAVRNRGLASRLLGEIRSEVGDDVDWLGAGFGATPELVEFWADNGFRTVHVSTTRNDESGEYSAVVLDPCSSAGENLATRHASWFLDRIESVLTDALSDLDPDVARAVLRATEGVPSLDFSEFEWRLVAGVPNGAGTIDTDPEPFRRLVLRHLVAPADADAFDDRTERVLVAKVLQARSWEAVGAENDFVSTAECMRAVGRAIERLAELYGTEAAGDELDRY